MGRDSVQIYKKSVKPTNLSVFFTNFAPTFCGESTNITLLIVDNYCKT